jgi:hypothetical protein
MVYLPSRDRLSVLTAVIVLAYVIMRALPAPAEGTVFSSPLLLQALIAALIGTGTDALIRSHPRFAHRTTLIHWIVPASTALVLGAGLQLLPDGPLWWLGLASSAVGLLLVLVTEYILVCPEDARYDLAALILTGLTYTLALLLFVTLTAYTNPSLISALIGGGVAAALAWRLFAFNVQSLRWAALYATLIGLTCTETLWAISYWRVSATGAALVAMLPFYLGVGLSRQQFTHTLSPRIWVEFSLVGAIWLILTFAYIWG